MGAAPELLARWAAVSGITGYRAADLAPHLKTVSSLLGTIAQGHGGADDNRDSRLLAAGADLLGWRWQHAHRAVRGCALRNRCTTGCTSGAKQSMAVSYLPRAEALGARILPDTRVLRILHDGRTVHGVLAAGPLGSPALLQRSRIQQRRVGRELALHVNLRTVARFRHEVTAERGTIFTAQLQEFSDRGILMMPSNISRGALAAALAGHSPTDVERFLDDYDRLGVYTTQVRLHGTATVRALPGGGVLVRHGMTTVDHSMLREAFRVGARLLFAAGAQDVTPPVSSAPALGGLSDVEEFCLRVEPGDWELVSVHGMASTRMGRADRGGVCDAYGRPYGFEGLRVCDAGVLPGVTGISPQGTIMAFAHEIVARFNNGEGGSRT